MGKPTSLSHGPFGIEFEPLHPHKLDGKKVSSITSHHRSQAGDRA